MVGREGREVEGWQQRGDVLGPRVLQDRCPTLTLADSQHHLPPKYDAGYRAE